MPDTLSDGARVRKAVADLRVLLEEHNLPFAQFAFKGTTLELSEIRMLQSDCVNSQVFIRPATVLIRHAGPVAYSVAFVGKHRGVLRVNRDDDNIIFDLTFTVQQTVRRTVNGFSLTT